MNVTVHQRPGVYSAYDASSVVSGSGAGRQTILNFDTVLPTPHLPTGRKSRNLGFWRAFVHFSRVGKVPRRRQDTPAILTQTFMRKKPPSRILNRPSKNGQ